MMDRVFAGFWRDGAVVQPEGKHFDKENFVIVKNKAQNTIDIRQQVHSRWEFFYWLDTTMPTELSPREAFELLKVINPDAERLEDDGGDWVLAEPGFDIIKWGDTTEYPAKWRVPTDADKGKKCRYRDDDDESFREGSLFICTLLDGRFLVQDEMGYEYTPWDVCEVLDS